MWIDDHFFASKQRQTPDSVIALLLGSDIMANSIWLIFAYLISQRGTALSFHINDPLLLAGKEQKL